MGKKTNRNPEPKTVTSIKAAELLFAINEQTDEDVKAAKATDEYKMITQFLETARSMTGNPSGKFTFNDGVTVDFYESDHTYKDDGMIGASEKHSTDFKIEGVEVDFHKLVAYLSKYQNPGEIGDEFVGEYTEETERLKNEKEKEEAEKLKKEKEEKDKAASAEEVDTDGTPAEEDSPAETDEADTKDDKDDKDKDDTHTEPESDEPDLDTEPKSDEKPEKDTEEELDDEEEIPEDMRNKPFINERMTEEEMAEIAQKGLNDHYLEWDAYRKLHFESTPYKGGIHPLNNTKGCIIKINGKQVSKKQFIEFIALDKAAFCREYNKALKRAIIKEREEERNNIVGEIKKITPDEIKSAKKSKEFKTINEEIANIRTQYGNRSGSFSLINGATVEFESSSKYITPEKGDPYKMNITNFKINGKEVNYNQLVCHLSRSKELTAEFLNKLEETTKAIQEKDKKQEKER